MGTTNKSITIPEEVVKDIEFRKKDHNFNFSAWVTSIYKKEFLHETQTEEPKEILATFTGDMVRLYNHGVKTHGWTLSYEEFVKIKGELDGN